MRDASPMTASIPKKDRVPLGSVASAPFLNEDHKNEQQHNHGEQLDLLGNWLYEWRIKTVLPHIKGRAIDIGCGTNTLIERHGNGIGVDVFQFGGADLIVDDTSNLPYANEEFDTVTIIAALNHIPYREKVLAEAYRILRPGGVLLITMIPQRVSKIWHFVRSPWDRDQHERGMEHDEVFGLSRVQVNSLVQNAGFEVIKNIPFMLGINTLTVAHKK